MITPANINTARRLVATWHDVINKRDNGQTSPLMAWLSEAKPLAGFTSRQRPDDHVVAVTLSKLVERYDARAAHVATATPPADIPDVGGDPMPDALPTPPAELVIRMYLPAYQRKRAEELDAATQDANRSAARSSVASTADALRQYEAEIRDKVKHLIAYADLDAEGRRLLAVAAHLREAAHLLDTHATPDQDNV